MKTKILLFLASLFAINLSGQVMIPPDSSFYYNPNGTKNWWYLQKDVFLYRMLSGACHTMSPNSTIDACEHLTSRIRKQNRIKFNPNATPIQKAMVINAIGTSTAFESASPAVSKTKNLNYSANQFVETNDLIIVRFSNEALNTPTALPAFTLRNNLAIYHQPYSNLTNPNSWSFIFRINADPRAKPFGTVFEICQYIWQNDSGFVTSCEPDMKLYEPNCEVVQEFSNNATSGTPDGLWHIRNQGQIAYNTFSGLAGADANICECWSEGFHGENVKVAVIDFDGYDFSHPELTGKFLNGWDCVNNQLISNTTFINNDSHGMKVASVISANANNNTNYNTVGVAYNSQVLPYIFDGNNSTAIIGIQKAVADGADIINMSFSSSSSTLSQSGLFTEIQNAKNNGRSGLGCFVVASSGNSNANGKFFPAADLNCFGVGATTASDFRAVVPTWGWIGGSNYYTPLSTDILPRYNVVAPGTRIYTAFTQAPLTSPSYAQGQINGTSYAAPIVSGIGAILLSKNSSLSVAQIEAAIQNNTDKVTTEGSYSAFPLLLGYNERLFYGRVNCLKALNSVPVGIKEYSQANVGLQFIKLSENEVGIFFDKGFNNKGCEVSVLDVTGKILSKTIIEPNATSTMVKTDNFSQGMYIITVVNKNEIGQAYKFIK